MMTILVVVHGGVAEVVESTVPQGYEVEIVDIDNLKEGDPVENLSDEAKTFLQREWPELMDKES
jgi:hypothetical protein